MRYGGDETTIQMDELQKTGTEMQAELPEGSPA
jgi:hypothetical protein